MSYLTSWYWDKGDFREKNEDSFSLQQVRLNGIWKGEEAALIIVCDGIGGLPEGETASGFVVQQMTEWFYQDGIGLMNGLFWTRRAAEGATDALEWIQEKMEHCERAEGIRCGTTCTMALVRGRRFVLLHVGDSRAYLLGRKERALTQKHRKGSALSRCIGAFAFHYPDVLEGRLGRREMLLLCSDGFCDRLKTGFLADAFMRVRRDKAALAGKLKEIGAFLRRQGEQDNQTAVLLLYTGGKRRRQNDKTKIAGK